MALLAESLVEEWLNRNGFFTIRGVKHGVGEMDLLAIRHKPDAILGWHVEVQASFRPIGYVCKLTKELADAWGGSRTSMKTRTLEQVESCVRQWVQDKFHAPKKIKLRQNSWSGVPWSFHLVHAVVRHQEELEVFKKEGVTCHTFHDVLADLCQKEGRSFSGSAGGDIAEIVNYYNSSRDE